MTVWSRQLDGTRWSGPTLVEGLTTTRGDAGDVEGMNGVNGLTCASPTRCFAWDEFDRLLTYDGSRWSTARYPALGGNQLNVSCGGPSFCLLDNTEGEFETFDGHSWSAAVRPSGTGRALGWMSCVASGVCFAIDGSDGIDRWAHGTWTASARSLDVPDEDDESGQLSAISCGGPDFCVAVDAQYDAWIYHGSWHQDPDVFWRSDGSASSASGGQGFGSISCTSAGRCLFVDVDGNAFVLDATWSGPYVDVNGAWRRSRTGVNSSRDLLNVVSCAPAARCLVEYGDQFFSYDY
jgi:hypothetical protein